jgi:hypothetical protein
MPIVRTTNPLRQPGALRLWVPGIIQLSFR